MKKLICGLAAAALALAGCSTTRPDVVSRYDAQRVSVVQDGTIVSIRPVTVEGSQSGGGGLAGGVVGAVAGSSIGGARESIIGGVIGAVAGAVAGNAIERGATREAAVEILVQLRNGERRSIVQAVGGETLYAGDPVIITTTGGRARVSRAAPAVAPRS